MGGIFLRKTGTFGAFRRLSDKERGDGLRRVAEDGKTTGRRDFFMRRENQRGENRHIKRLIGFLAVAFVVWSAMFLTDYYRCVQSEAPIFALSFDDVSYFGLGYRIAVARGENGGVREASMTMFGRVFAHGSVESAEGAE